jgi:Uncharacterized conserved protein (DUF2190)
MSALTNDRDTVRKEGNYASYPVKGGAVIYAGAMVCIGADGYAVPASDTAGLKFMGVARAYVDNSAGASGSLQVEVWRRGCFNLAASGMALSNAGDDVYALDDQTVGLTSASTNHIKCGVISEYVSAASVYVDISRI